MDLFRLTALSALIASGFVSAQAAQVPAGTVLAANQEIVRQIKAEPASVAPAKVVGLREAQVARDLLEGLGNQGADGKPTPGVAQSWQTTDNKR